jgi:tRNA(Arg) A34 adenosine deaminase TadA
MRAARIAEVGTGRSRHGALVVKGGSVLGVGINRSRVHDTWIVDRPRDTCSIHAEVSAMRNADYPFRASVYVARTNGKGELRSSAPCVSCSSFLEQFEVKKVVHT